MTTLHQFTGWLAATPLSNTIQSISWLVPALQTLHILAIAVVVSSVSILDLRLLDVAGRDQSVRETAARFLPWVWGAVGVLAASGVVLIVGEPARELLNPSFQAKIVTILIVLVLTAVFQRRLKTDPAAWLGPEGRGTSIAAKGLGLVSLLLWVAIVVFGRWIAYVLEN